MSVYQDVLDAVTTKTSTALTGSGATIILRKLPLAQEVLATLPAVVISPSATAPKWKRLGFGQVQLEYLVQITIVAAGNRDFSNNIDTYNGWYQSIRREFEIPSNLGVTEIWKADIKPGVVFNRAALNLNYDYLPIDIIFSSVEIDG